MIGAVKGKLLVSIVFLLGIGTGAISTYEYNTRIKEPQEAQVRTRGQRERRAKQDIDRFHDYLGLAPDQREKIKAILEADRAKFREFQQKVRPEFQALQKSTRDKVREILTDEQKQKYDDYFAQRQRGRRNSPQD